MTQVTRKEIDDALHQHIICGECDHFANCGTGPHGTSRCNHPVPMWAVGYICVDGDPRYVCPFDDASKCEAFKRKV